MEDVVGADDSALPETSETEPEDTRIATVSNGGLVVTTKYGESKLIVTETSFGSTAEALLVNVDEIIGIEIVQEPTKTVYKLGESLNTSGLLVKTQKESGLIGDNITEKVSISVDSLDQGNHTVTVSYLTYEDTFTITVIDMSELDKIKAELAKLVETDYTEESWKAIQDKIAAAEAKTTQEEFDSAVAGIDLDTLVAKPIDTSALDKIKEDMSKLQQSDYTEESWQAILDKIAEAETKDLQSKFDSAVAGISLGNLVPKAIKEETKEELANIKEEVENLVETDYTEESWTDLQDKIEKAEQETVQSELEKEISEIDLGELVPKEFTDESKEELANIKEEVENLVETDYTEESWQELQNKIEEAEAKELQSEFDRALTEIVPDELVAKEVDPEKLDEIRENLGSLEKSDYTEESWKEVEDKIADAETKELQSEFDKAVSEIDLGELVPEEIKEETMEELANIKEEVENLVETDYTEESWQELQDKIEEAEQQNVQSELDKSLSEIDFGVLVPKEIAEESKQELDEIKESLGSLEESDYTEESWKEVEDKIADAETKELQSEFDKAVSEIDLGELVPNELTEESKEILAEIKEEVAKLNEDDYTEESWKELQDKIKEAEVQNVQSELDKSLSEIDLGDLIPKTLDRSALEKIKTDLAKLVEPDYTEASWKAIEDKIAEAEEQRMQTALDSIVATIDLDSLIPEEIDTSALDKIKDDMSKLVEEDYTEESWKAIEDKIADAETKELQSEFDEVVETIDLDSLVAEEISEETKEELANIKEEVEKLVEEDYTEESWKDLEDKITEAETEELQSELDKKLSEIDLGSLEAKEITEESKEELANIKEEIENLVAEDYTEESWKAIEDKIADAETKELQSEFDKAVSEIDLKDLVANPVDTSALDKIKEDMSKLVEEDYTEESWKAIEDKFADAETKELQSEFDKVVETIDLGTLVEEEEVPLAPGTTEPTVDPTETPKTDEPTTPATNVPETPNTDVPGTPNTESPTPPTEPTNVPKTPMKDEIEEIVITVLPDKLVYEVMESLDLTGMQVFAKMKNGEMLEITKYVVIGLHSVDVEGKQEISVQYEDFEDTFEIEIVAKLDPVTPGTTEPSASPTTEPSTTPTVAPTTEVPETPGTTEPIETPNTPTSDVVGIDDPAISETPTSDGIGVGVANDPSQTVPTDNTDGENGLEEAVLGATDSKETKKVFVNKVLEILIPVLILLAIGVERTIKHSKKKDE
jgi:hypothetical protein